ncbi:MAG TPA: tetratricopeptide repeat protein [Niabella sp.]|nr:tetratricopeptide repeat protein [Niabella sp.]
MKLPLLIPILIAAFCLTACNKNDSSKSVIPSGLYVKAESLFENEKDSAFYYFNKVASESNNNLLAAAAYTYMGIIQHKVGDYFGSQESLLLSLKHLDEKSEKEQGLISSNYNELGNNSRSLKKFDEALHYYNLALVYSKDQQYRLTNLNNKAVVFQAKKQYNQAIAIYDSILSESRSNNREYARVLSNMAKTKWLNDPDYNATPELHEALQTRKNENDTWGLNASYSHLSDYYGQTQPDSALIYANKMLNIAKQLNSPDDEAEALQKLITLSPAHTIKKYFARYQQLNDSLQTARNSAKNQFALIRYEAEKHKSENLVLQKENAEKKVRIIGQQVILGGIVILSFAILFWYRRQKQQSLREQQLKTSQKVHDVVANGLYRIMIKMEYQPGIEKQQLLDDMEVLYEQSRDISYETTDAPKQSFNDEIAELLKSFSTEHTSISIVGNNHHIWNGLNESARTELKRALQELMVNMKKHSAAKNVVVKFDEGKNGLHIRYTDDGKGVPADFHYGNGLRNTENRIKSIGGQFTFNYPSTAGLNIQIFIPIS